jgi:hypothetical protein
MDTFNDGPSYGDGFSLQKDTIPDICALLVGFLDSLPHSLIHPVLYGPFWYWCLMPTVRRQNIKREHQYKAEANQCCARFERGEQIPVAEFVYQEKPLRWTKVEEYDNIIKERPQIAAAVTLLQLLPTANLSLLLYLFGFLTQLPLCPENGIQPDDITRIFAHTLMGGKSKSDAMKLMLWFLHRWPKISEEFAARSTTSSEEELKTPTLSVGDFPLTSSESLLDALDDYSRMLTSRYTELVTQEEPRRGLYQFADKGFPASQDLYALSQVVAGENLLHNKTQLGSMRRSCSHSAPVMSGSGGCFILS